MSASTHPVAVDHPTVVPTNFETGTDPCPECESEPCEC